MLQIRCYVLQIEKYYALYYIIRQILDKGYVINYELPASHPVRGLISITHNHLLLSV